MIPQDIDVRKLNISFEHEDYYSDWIDKVNRGFSLARQLNFPERVDTVVSAETRDIFKGWLRHFATLGRHKQAYEIYDCMDVFRSIEAAIHYRKTGSTIKLGLDEQGLYMRMSLVERDNLKNMTDVFWQAFLTLSQLGDFSLEENEVFGLEERRKSPHLFHEFGSPLFLLLRNYIISSREQGEAMDLGWLSLRWKADTEFDVVHANAYHVFEIFYYLNYSLWRVSAQRRTKAKKSQA